MNEQMVKIRLYDRDGIAETVWAFPAGENLYQLDNNPFFAYGISWQDIVEAHPAPDGFLEFTRRVEKSGNRTIRIILDELSDNPQSQFVLTAIRELGCDYEGLNSKLISINIPANVELTTVVEFLIKQETLRWEYADPTYEEVNGSDIDSKANGTPAAQ